MAKTPTAFIENVLKSDDNLCKSFGHAGVKINSSFFIHGGAAFGKNENHLTVSAKLVILTIKEDGEVDTNFIKPENGSAPARYLHHLSHIENEIIAFGGTSSTAWRRSDPSMFKFSLKNLSWSPLKCTGNIPHTIGSTANTVNDLIFVFGGMAFGEVTNAMWIFNHKQSQWMLLPSTGQEPSQRCDHGSATVAPYIYYFGGCGERQEYHSDLYRFHTGALSWEKIRVAKGPSITPRAGMLFVPHQNKDIYLVGGYNDTIYPDGGPVTDNLLKYSIKTKQWKIVRAIPNERNDEMRVLLSLIHSCGFVSYSRLITCGGMTCEGETDIVFVIRLLSPSERDSFLKAPEHFQRKASQSNSSVLSFSKDDNSINKQQEHVVLLDEAEMRVAASSSPSWTNNDRDTRIEAAISDADNNNDDDEDDNSSASSSEPPPIVRSPPSSSVGVNVGRLNLRQDGSSSPSSDSTDDNNKNK